MAEKIITDQSPYLANITVKTKEEIEILRTGGGKLAAILKKTAEASRLGVSCLELNSLAERLIFESGGEPAFKGYKSKGGDFPFPAALCVSINSEIVHGIPKDRKLVEGDLLKLDLGMRWPAGTKGLFTDTALTLEIGKIPVSARRLVKITREALAKGISRIRDGARVGDISSAIQNCLDKNRVGIVRDLAGHGVGYAVHEDPLVPNYGQAGVGPVLKTNMVLAVEVMTTLGNGRIKLAEDGWAYQSADGALGAHFEHTVAVTDAGAEILTEA